MKVALAIGCDPALARRRVQVITASAVEDTPLIAVPSLRRLGHHLRNVEVVCHDLPPQSAVDGLLGLNVRSHLPPFRAFLSSIHSYLL